MGGNFQLIINMFFFIKLLHLCTFKTANIFEEHEKLFLKVSRYNIKNGIRCKVI